MPTRGQVCAWMVGFGLVVPALAAAQDRTEQDVVDLIVRNGPQAQLLRAETGVVRSEQLARLAYRNPSVTYSREGAGFAEFLQVEQALPLFGTRAALARAGVAATEAAEAERDGRLWMLRTEAAAVVATWSAAETRLDAARAHAQDVERFVEILRVREREGEGSRFDRLRTEQELRDIRQRITAAAVDASDARAAVVAMLPPDVAIGRVAATPSLAARPAPASAEALTTRAISARAELRALEHSTARADLEAEAARRARLPEPVITGGLKRADAEPGRRQGAIFGVTASLPLFDTGNREAARWTAERLRAEAARTSIERRIRVDIARASQALELRQSALAEEVESAGDELTAIADVGYREGELGILELLDAVRTAARARMRAIELQLDARLAQIDLERVVGDVLWP